MKRFVWLLLVAFCTAIAQVQPVAPLQAKQASCDCCDGEASACGMRDCAPAPSAPATGSSLVLASGTSTLRAQADSVMPKSRSFRDHYYAQFAPRPALPAKLAPQAAAPTASVPVFKAHCSFLI